MDICTGRTVHYSRKSGEGALSTGSPCLSRLPRGRRRELYQSPHSHALAGPQFCLPLHGRVCHVPEIHEFGSVLLPGDGLAAEGGALARETVANWCIKCALEYFQPVYDLLHEELLKREILHADKTVCQVLHEEGKAAVSKSYLWIYLTGNDGLAPIILYEYQPGRQGEYAKNFLEGFRGLLECDGYTGYNRVENVIMVCCLAHCRRYFFEAIPAAHHRKIKLLDINSPEESPAETADPEKAKKQQQPAAEIGLCYCNWLFHIERTLKAMDAQERMSRRLELEVPVWDDFWKWLGTVKPLGGRE